MTFTDSPLVLKEDTVLSANIDDYPGGIIIPIDKPYRWTSADVIRKVKYQAVRHFHKKNLKVGHAGTLDPLATGLLLVCIGNATKMAETLQSHDKEYIAGITFGATTPSYDLEKEIDRHFPYGHINENAIRDALEKFIGEQDQVAPLFSAKSVDGTRAYELARKLLKEKASGQQGNPDGPADFDTAAEKLIRTARIRINSLELLSFGQKETPDNEKSKDKAPEGNASSRINVTDNSGLGLPSAKIRISCSKGTYVRAFARDLGEELGSGAYLDSLVRSKSGDFDIKDALTVEQAVGILAE